jgi:RNA:NAD 2'-phosphotransferase (TPT1/KptA family)/ADP-ribose pyrophosphatase YjhB (NUDIX family)
MNGVSKSMSYLLRHGLEKENITHENGFVLIDNLIGWIKSNMNVDITLEDVINIVNTDNKKRFQINENKIRANQGHSVQVEMNFEKVDSIEEVYPLAHATYAEHIESILIDGLKSMSRTHIHFATLKDNDFKMIRKDTDTFCILNKTYKDISRSDNNVYLSKDSICKGDFNIVTFTKKLNCYGGIIFDKDRKNIIIVKAGEHNYGFPKGKRHKEELPFQTALREVNEETMLKPNEINFIQNTKSINEMSSHGGVYAIGYFIGWTDKKDLHFINKEENIQTSWMKIEEAICLLPDKRREILQNIIKNEF